MILRLLDLPIDYSFQLIIFEIRFAVSERSLKLLYTVKIRIFYGKIPGIWLPVHLPLFLRASTCKPFLEIKIR